MRQYRPMYPYTIPSSWWFIWKVLICIYQVGCLNVESQYKFLQANPTSSYTEVGEIDVKCRQTIGCLDQYIAPNNEHIGPRNPIPPPTQNRNSHTLKQFMPKGCSNGCSLDWSTRLANFHVNPAEMRWLVIFISKGKNTAERFITYMVQWSFDTLIYSLNHEWF